MLRIVDPNRPPYIEVIIDPKFDPKNIEILRVDIKPSENKPEKK